MKYQWLGLVCFLAIFGGSLYGYYEGVSLPPFDCRKPRSDIVKQAESIRLGDSLQDALSKIQAQPNMLGRPEPTYMIWTWDEKAWDNKMDYQLFISLVDGNVTSVGMSSDTLSDRGQGFRHFLTINKLVLALQETSSSSRWSGSIQYNAIFIFHGYTTRSCLWERNFDGMPFE